MGHVGYKEHFKIGTSPAEMVYGSTITVRGDSMHQSTTMSVPQHLKCLRQQVENLRPALQTFKAGLQLCYDSKAVGYSWLLSTIICCTSLILDYSYITAMSCSNRVF